MKPPLPLLKLCLAGGAAALCWISGLEPLNWFGASWMGWFFLFYILLQDRIRGLQFFAVSLPVSAAYFGWGLYGLRAFSVGAHATLTVLLSILIALYLGCVRLSLRASLTVNLVVISGLYLLLDFLLGLSPLGSMAVESLFYGSLPFLQSAALPFLGFRILIIFVLGLNFSLAWVIAKDPRRGGISTVVFILGLAALYFWGAHRAGEVSSLLGKKVAIIQHNLPMGDPWADEHAAEILQTYESTALEAASSKPDLIVFPFYDLPQDPERHPEWPQKLADQTGIPFILGAHIPVTHRDQILTDGYHSKLFYFHPDSGKNAVYEAVMGAPFQPIPEKTASEYTLLITPSGRIGGLLCYEDTRPEIAAKAKHLGADFLVSLSNPGHFQKTMIPRYHLIQDQLRAIETELPLIRVSANGHSAFIDSRGRILQKTELSEKKVLVQEI